ncbi:MAG: DUF3703 domain-containing protein [Burkholderiaceae bacterium]
MTPRHRLYARLIDGFHARPAEPPHARWRWLEAAHVTGQGDFRLHCHSHVEMLRYALALRDFREAAGQVFRLALVPLGHALGRLPAGNTGRAAVNAFRPMPVPPDVEKLIQITRVK